MAPDWLDLHEGESVRLKTHPSNWLMFREFVIFAIVTAAVVGIRLSGVIADLHVGEYAVQNLLLVVIPLAAIPVLMDWLVRRFTVYVVTDDQVWKKKGILNREIDPLGLEEIVDIEIHQNGLERYMKKGEVAIANAGAGEWDMKLTNVPKPTHVASVVRRAKDEQKSDEE